MTNCKKKVADYFAEQVRVTDYLPRCDFRQPAEPVIYDSTAGAIAAYGMLELAKNVDESRKFKYEQCAAKMMKAMDEKGNRDISIIYGDYFYTEAVLRLLEKEFFIW